MLDDRFGFVIRKFTVNDGIPGRVGWNVRRETDPAPLYTLHTGSAIGLKVSPDGRRIAYWTGKELRVLEVAPDSRPRTLLTIGSTENASYAHLAWSSDSTGLVAGVVGDPAASIPDAVPAYTALRVVDVAGSTAREIIRIPGNIVPVAWDRQARVISAYMQMCCGARYYYVVQEAGTFKRADVTGPTLYVIEASEDGQNVMGRGDPNRVIRVWPRDSYEGGVEYRADSGKSILAAAWRPGTSEIAVLFADHLEFWNASDAHRPIALALPANSSPPTIGTLVFRADGEGVVASRSVLLNSGLNIAYSVMVDLESGLTTEIEGPFASGTLPQPGTSVRIGS